ncbi:MAG: hypothetical protein ACI85F_002468 [Bacteroidia bacterium]|jgi:hypothetical protein
MKLTAILIILSQFVLAQTPDTIPLKIDVRLAAKAQFYFAWGDSEYMELAPNGRIYQLKDGLEDGLYVASFDKELSWKKAIGDTAFMATVKDGEIEGVLRRWDDIDKLIAEECEYKNGRMSGYRKLYFFDPEGNRYTNIEVFEDGLPLETLQIEW